MNLPPRLLAAASGHLLGYGDMRVIGAVQGVADALGQFLRRQQAVGLDHLALVCTHLGSIGLSQGLLTGNWQTSRRTPVPLALTCRLWSRTQARTSLLICQEALSQTSSRARLPRAAACSQHQSRKTRRHRADRAAVEEAQPDLAASPGAARRSRPAPSGPGRPWRPPARPAAGAGRRPPRRAGRGPPGGSTRPRPRSRGASRGGPSAQADQAVAPPFFRAYAGSGLVIQRLARSQRTPSRASVARIVSPVTAWSWSGPAVNASSAARSSVHRLVWCPKSRGLRCSSARSRSAAAGREGRLVGVDGAGALGQRRRALLVEGVDRRCAPSARRNSGCGRSGGCARRARWRRRSDCGGACRHSRSAGPAPPRRARRPSADAQREGAFMPSKCTTCPTTRPDAALA